MQYTHRELAKGRWQKLTLMEQFGNIGSEFIGLLHGLKKKAVTFPEYL